MCAWHPNDADSREFFKTRILALRTRYCRIGQKGIAINAVEVKDKDGKVKNDKDGGTVYDYWPIKGREVEGDGCYHKIDIKSGP